MTTALIGGQLGYRMLRRIAGSPPRQEACSGSAYCDRSKFETLLGSSIWQDLTDKVVLDFGCGSGQDAIEIAKRGARKVIGVDIRDSVLDLARQKAAQARVADRTVFVREPSEQVDVVVSVDAFEHFADPAGVLESIKRLLKPNGRVLISFGPPWYHPLGGHLFSVFPWAHLIFTEEALIRWRADFKTDGAKRFGEVEGGLNQMTLRRFRRLIDASGYQIESLDAVPIRKCRALSKGPMREFFTSIVRCRLVLPDSPSHVH
jgi:SAM-dependent methyltransferase